MEGVHFRKYGMLWELPSLAPPPPQQPDFRAWCRSFVRINAWGKPLLRDLHLPLEAYLASLSRCAAEPWVEQCSQAARDFFLSGQMMRTVLEELHLLPEAASATSSASSSSSDPAGRAGDAMLDRYFPGLPRDAVFCVGCASHGHRFDLCPLRKCRICGSGEAGHLQSGCPLLVVAAAGSPPRPQATAKAANGHRRGSRGKRGRQDKGAVVGEPMPMPSGCRFCLADGAHVGVCPLVWRSFAPNPASKRKASPMTVSCYVCGLDDHFGGDCSQNRGEHISGRRFARQDDIWTREYASQFAPQRPAGDLARLLGSFDDQTRERKRAKTEEPTQQPLARAAVADPKGSQAEGKLAKGKQAKVKQPQTKQSPAKQSQAKQPAQQPQTKQPQAKEPRAKQPQPQAKQPAQQPQAKQPVQQPQIKQAKDKQPPSKQPQTKQPGKELAKQPAQQQAKQPAKQPAKQSKGKQASNTKSPAPATASGIQDKDGAQNSSGAKAKAQKEKGPGKQPATPRESQVVLPTRTVLSTAPGTIVAAAPQKKAKAETANTLGAQAPVLAPKKEPNQQPDQKAAGEGKRSRHRKARARQNKAANATAEGSAGGTGEPGINGQPQSNQRCRRRRSSRKETAA